MQISFEIFFLNSSSWHNPIETESNPNFLSKSTMSLRNGSYYLWLKPLQYVNCSYILNKTFCRIFFLDSNVERHVITSSPSLKVHAGLSPINPWPEASFSILWPEPSLQINWLAKFSSWIALPSLEAFSCFSVSNWSIFKEYYFISCDIISCNEMEQFLW